MYAHFLLVMSTLLDALFAQSWAHALFDLLAWLASMASLWLVATRLLPPASLAVARLARPVTYVVVAVLGLLFGALAFGTANLLLSGGSGIGLSILGAFAGGIAAIELYKPLAGIRQSTGIVFAVPLCVSVAIGRIGCFLAGLPDFTYGTPTDLPWGVDFGDGIARHPVQLYESLAMTAFLALLLSRLWRQDQRWLQNGFYLTIGCYAGQRFVWEFFKPYAALFGPFNLFHLVCAALFVYAAIMIARHPLPHIARETHHA